MAYIKHEYYFSTTSEQVECEQVENELLHKDELIRILSSYHIQFEIHLFLLKIFDASFMHIQDYKSDENNNRIINAIRNCIDIKTLDLSNCINIPKTIEGFPFLTTIIFPLFLNFIPRINDCPSITKISIPKNGVEYIESDNFKNYPPIDELVLDEHLSRIDSYAFSSCMIKRVDLSQCNNLDQRNIKIKAFSHSSIEEIVFPYQVTILPFGAFSNCKQLRTITGSYLCGTFFDEYNKGFAQFDRAVHSCEFCFDNCINLQYIQFSPELSIEGIRLLYCHSGYDEGNSSSDPDGFYYDKRCGIVLEIDGFYSYIWCFTDFTFYLSKKLDNTFLNRIVSFYNSNDRNIEMKDGKCWISSNCNDHIALGVSLGCNYMFNNKFNKQGCRLGVVTTENDQNKAVKIYEQQTLLQDVDIRSKVQELETFVDNLDIDSIIDSYHSVREYKYISHYRSDDDERLGIYRSSSYSDSYLETLLPTQQFISERGFSDSNNYELGSMSEEKLKNDDDIIKKNALERYDKEDHKCFIINRFIIDAIENEKFVEKCLRINEARDLLMRYKNKVDGNQKVILLNSIV